MLMLEVESPSGAKVVPLSFTTKGYNLVATMAGEESDIECQGWIDGNSLRFYYSRTTDEGEFVAKYTGHVAGDLMGGEVDMGEMGKTKWKATRGTFKGIDLSGTWTMKMEGDSPSGQENVEITFSQDGPTLIASMKGDSGQVDCEGFIAGNALRFYYTRGDFVAKYTGHVGGDVMGGEVDLGEQGKTAWKATRN
jgi:hypothetical protein